MKFDVLITETLSKKVEVEAENEEQAYHIVEERWKNSEIVLSGDDFQDKNIEVFERG